MISLENVSKKFGTGVFGLSNISLSVDRGEFVFLVGPTGSGKTTIFRLLIRETLPTEGNIVVDSWDLTKLPNKKVAELRKKIGVVFQDLKLLPDRTILENTTLPLEISGFGKSDAIKKAEKILKKVGIIEHKEKFPVQLSGGEVQRAAIARALVLYPDIILADEPTGNLDDDTSWEIVKLLAEINEGGTTIIMATHNRDIVKKLNKRLIELDKGNIIINDKDFHKKKSKPKEEKHTKEAKDKGSKVKVKEDSSDVPADVKALADKKVKEDREDNSKENKGEKKESIGKKDDKLKTDEFEKALKE